MNLLTILFFAICYFTQFLSSLVLYGKHQVYLIRHLTSNRFIRLYRIGGGRRRRRRIHSPMFWSRTSHLLCSYHYLSRFSQGSGSHGSVLTSLSPELVVNTTGSESYVPRLAGSLRTPCVCLSAVHDRLLGCRNCRLNTWGKLLYTPRDIMNVNCFFRVAACCSMGHRK